MGLKKSAAVLWAAASLWAADPAHAAHQPVEAFAALPAMRSPHLSPDGTRIAYIKDYNGRATIAIMDLTGQSGASS